MLIDDKKIEEAGELFGRQITALVATALSQAVTVEDVNLDSNYAKVSFFEGDSPISVPLSVLNIKGATLRVVPTKGSTAIIERIDGNLNTPRFVGFSQIDSIIFERSKSSFTFSVDPDDDTKDYVDAVVGDSSIRISSDEITFNGGENGGLVLVGKLTERLNKLQNEIDQIQTNILAHTHATPAGPTTATTYTKVVLSQVQDGDYENEKIKQ